MAADPRRRPDAGRYRQQPGQHPRYSQRWLQPFCQRQARTARHGTVYYRRITGSTELSSDIERIAIDATFGRQILPTDVLRISWLVFCRLDSDTVEIEHMTDSEGLAAAQLVFRGIRDDEF